MRYVWVTLMIACGSSQIDAAPKAELHPVKREAICVTKGAVTDASVTEPTVRAFAVGAGGDAAQLTFKFRGDSDSVRELANGSARRQVGLKLRAQDSCNVVYVMWRLDPKPKLDISVKSNPGKRTHEECGAEGYTKVKPHKSVPVPALDEGSTHTLRAEISGDELVAWIDGKAVWQGTLPAEARAITGPAGLRSDNVKFDLLELAAPKGGEPQACRRHEHDD